MSDFDNLTTSAQDELVDRHNTDQRKSWKHRKNRDTHRKLLLIALIVSISLFVFSQLSFLLPWLFGIPVKTTQENMVILLNNTQKKIETYRRFEGAYPEHLPSGMPPWLINYQKTEDGYQLEARIDGVIVELVRDAKHTTIKKYH